MSKYENQTNTPDMLFPPIIVQDTFDRQATRKHGGIVHNTKNIAYLVV